MVCFRGKWIISNLLSHQQPGTGTAFVFQLGLHNAHPQRSCAFPRRPKTSKHRRSLEKKKHSRKKNKESFERKAVLLSDCHFISWRVQQAQANVCQLKQGRVQAAACQPGWAAHSGCSGGSEQHQEPNTIRWKKAWFQTTQNSCCSQSK